MHTGRIIKLGDDIDTDIIISGKYMVFKTVDEMAKYAFSIFRPEIPSIIKPGDIFICGKISGVGHHVNKILRFFIH